MALPVTQPGLLCSCSSDVSMASSLQLNGSSCDSAHVSVINSCPSDMGMASSHQINGSSCNSACLFISCPCDMGMASSHQFNGSSCDSAQVSSAVVHQIWVWLPRSNLMLFMRLSPGLISSFPSNMGMASSRHFNGSPCDSADV